MANRIIFDTETTDIDKCFAYDVGYLIVDENFKILKEEHFVIRQVWYNLPLFATAYYADKRPLYVNAMRRKQARLVKWETMVSELTKDIEDYGVVSAYAFNSEFDDRVFKFNSEWYRSPNPFEGIPIFDIMGYSSQFITNKQSYYNFCDSNNLYTEKGFYPSSAESVYRFITDNPNFAEAHMGLHDAQIEMEILRACANRGAKWDEPYKKVRFSERAVPATYAIKVNGEIIHEGEYVKKMERNGVFSFTEKIEEVVE